MKLENQIAGCFGDVDNKFALNQLDEGRAFDLLGRLRSENMTWDDAKKEIKKAVRGDKDHIKKQMKQVKARFKPWLG